MSQLPPPTTAPAGWYPDPAGPGERYFDGRRWAATRPRLAEADPHPTLPLNAAVGALVVLVASLIVARAFVESLIGFDWPLLVYVVLLAVVGYGPSVAWIAYVRRRWAGGSLASIGFRFRWSDLGWGPLTWIAAVATQIVVAAMVLVLDIPLSSNVESVSDLEADRAYLIATTVTAVVAAPIIEEIVFRGLVLRGLLSRCAATVAIIVQGVLFGLAHVDPVRGVGNVGLVLVLSGVGVAFGVSAYLTRRLGPSIIGHAIFNAVVLAIVLTGAFGDLDTDLGESVGSRRESVVVDQADVAEPDGQEHDRG
jgi:membrane protease YdiL (CAAX protease family)